MHQKTVVTISDGSRVVVPDSNDIATTYILREQEDWFEDEIQFVRMFARNGIKSIDIGASYGLYTLALAGMRKSGTVHAFEPTPDTADCLAETMKLNTCANAVLYRAGVSDAEGTGYLCFGTSPELNAVVRDIPTGQEGVAVPLVRLDDLFAESGSDVDFVKMDAEGEEERILDGGRRFFAAQSPLVMYEFKCDSTYNLRLLEAFDSMGYRSYRLVPGLKVMVPFDVQQPPDGYLMNLFCCKEDRARRLREAGLLVDTEGEVNQVEGAWKETWQQMPCMRGIALLESLGAGLSSRQRRYHRALDLVACAEDEGIPVASRLAALSQADLHLSMLCSVEPTASRLCTHARVLFTLGLREKAVEALYQALDMCLDPTDARPAEPFFPASPSYDQREGYGELRQRLTVSILEQLVTRIALSGFSVPEATINLCDMIVATGCVLAPAMERRRQLARMAMGVQKEPQPYLRDETASGLNEAYWRTGRST